ncbi:MAG: homoserine dehydrogenase [Lachnospiraceae bacterium]|nr:homoserine dehydrogenase [Lachnospiraceae bacterium]
MAEIAVMGYGTVGAGVVRTLIMNSDTITRRVGERIHVKRVLDLREFPGTQAEEILTHDFRDILEDPEISVVVETMGGLKPAYEFTKQLLLAGKSVCTSNKELVAEHGVELRAIARDMSCNYLFEASCGGGIPIIRVLGSSLTAEEIEEVTGILNGTTNYILTSMADEGKGFEVALKEAQDKGYAELHPEADVEGYDACRKIAILSSLAYGHHISYKDVPTQGITDVDETDIAYADAMGCRIKLLATSRREEEGTWALVAPMMIGRENPLTAVDDVMNAVMVKGNAVGTTMFYGSGAGSLPTASAVCGDVIEAVKYKGSTIKYSYSGDTLELLPVDAVERPFFVRMRGTEEEAKALFGEIADVTRLPQAADEIGFLTPVMKEKEFKEKAGSAEAVIKWYRRGKKEEAEE